MSNSEVFATARAEQERLRLIRLPEVRKMVGLSRSEIYRRMALDQFPKPVAIGESARAWVNEEITAWVQQRIAARG